MQARSSLWVGLIDRVTGSRAVLLATWLAMSAVLIGQANAQDAKPGANAASAPRVLHLSFPAPETGFDPGQISDLYSATAIAHIMESLYGYDHLARPFKVKPVTAAAMPEVTDDFRNFVIRVKPGIYFDNDPAFNGKKRELTAEDYVFSIKRIFDPALKSPSLSGLREEGIVGMNEMYEELVKSKKPFDYDRPVDGIKALDRYTLQIKLAESRPRFIYTLTNAQAVAREVAEKYGLAVMEHPVGTGPYRLAQWRRSSQMVFERNPNYREVLWDAQPNADDVEGQAMLAKLKGRKLPLVDRVEVSIVEESQPRWLAFLNGQFDIVGVPLEFANVAVPNGELAPNLEKRGIRMQRTLGADVTMFYFNMENPVVGGYTPEKIALRRAISLATDVKREIQIARRGQAIPAQSAVAPNTYGYDPEFRSENSEYSVAKSKALLDMYGYVDKDGDGWRDLPDGKPLTIEYATQPDQISRQFDELWKKNLDAVNVRIAFKVAKWPEQLKQARAGTLMLWALGSSSSTPDGQGALELSYGPAAGGANLARFKLEAFDKVYRKMNDLPDGPERLALFLEAKKILTAYMPYKYNVHRIGTSLSQPWIEGYRSPTFWRESWQYMDITK
ncbi:ABC transporter substrate-binding protein [soil metagenome]